LVESTDDFDEPVTIRAGVTEGVPEFLSHSLLGRKIGDRIQVIFEEGMEDLPTVSGPPSNLTIEISLTG